nr:30S ribosomal protein S3-like [Lytechinus pictus]
MRLRTSAVGKIEIERFDGNIKLIIHSARPGSVLGQNAKNLENINLLIKKTIKKRDIKILIDVVEVEDFALDPMIVAQDIARRIEQRESYRFVQKSALSAAQRRGATGAKITIGGRLNGADISRKQTIGFGKLPLSQLSSKIEYGYATAKTTYGQLGIKV